MTITVQMKPYDNLFYYAFIISDANTGEMLDGDVRQLQGCFNIDHMPPGIEYTLTVYEPGFHTRKQAYQALDAISSGQFPRDDVRVQCVETGEIFKNQKEAAEKMGVNQGQLSKHLQGSAWYRTVQGKTFKRII